MSNPSKIEAYFETEHPFKDAILTLRTIVKQTELVETFKWSAPVYTIDGKNVAGIGKFKHHFGVWFFNGSLIKDKYGRLHNAQEGKTKALRQLRYTDATEIKEDELLYYLNEAISNQKKGLEVKATKPVKKVVLPTELTQAFSEDKNLEKAFKALTPGRQKEYAEHIASAKQEKTRLSRLEKATPLILDGKGLHDKYKNC
ncbi:MAG: YdeI/OmpD-associated family protein [Bacteroidota bacterium]|nr:YdeI/OmpD-associated family protein [Bacteroidota bacterium]